LAKWPACYSNRPPVYWGHPSENGRGAEPDRNEPFAAPGRLTSTHPESGPIVHSSGNGAFDDSVERYRQHLELLVARLARWQLDAQLMRKIDLSGVVQQTLFEAHQAGSEFKSLLSGRRARGWLHRVLDHNLKDEIRKLCTDKRDAHRERSLEQAIQDSSLRLE